MTRQFVGCILSHMRTIDEVFDEWDTLTAMAADVGWTRDAVEKWKERKSIPSRAWPAVIAAAKARGKRLSAEQLLSMHRAATRRASGN